MVNYTTRQVAIVAALTATACASLTGGRERATFLPAAWG